MEEIHHVPIGKKLISFSGILLRRFRPFPENAIAADFNDKAVGTP